MNDHRQHLSHHEELVRLVQQGDREALSTLCTVFAPLVEASARRYLGWRATWDDLMQIGYEQLISGLQQFDPERGVFLGLYLKRKVQGGIWTAVRRDERHKERQSSLSVVMEDEDILLGVEGFADEKSASDFYGVEWQELMAPLSPREKLAIRYTVLMDYTDRELAEVYGVSKDTVKTWRKRAIAKLRKGYAAIPG